MRRSMIVGLFLVLMLGLAAPAWAQATQTSEAFVVLSGRADVPQGQQVGDLVVFHGSATVDGTVDGATIGGQRKRVQTNTNWEGFGWAGKLAWWLAVSVSTLVVGLVLVWLVGRGAAWILEAGRTSIGPAIGWGLLVFFGLPILAIIALVTLVGIPLGLGVLAALGLIYALGYGASAWIVGRRILRAPTAWILAFLVGWGILRVLALIPILGGLVWFAAVVFGLRALVVAIWHAGGARRAAASAQA